MIDFSSIIYKINIYSSTSFLEKIKQLKIKVINLINISNNIYEIEIPYKYKKIFEQTFSNYEIIKIKGLKYILSKIMFYKFSLISLIISICFFIYLTKIIFVIEINGLNEKINQEIRLYLEEKNVKKYAYIPSISKLKTYKDEYFLSNVDKLQNLDFLLFGNKIVVNYETKDKEIIIDKKKGKMYSKFDCIIDKISISSGNVLVKENQYVKENELLVDDYLYYKDQEIFVGTRGYIYAYTFNLVELNYTCIDSEVDTFTFLLDKARNTIYNSFDNEFDRIDKEQIIEFKYLIKENKSYLKVLYTNYQNIIKY